MYRLENLKYSFSDLEPFIDTHTLGLHYKKHAQNYLNKLNELLILNNYEFDFSMEELAKIIINYNMKDIDNIMFNLGGVLNHNIYFRSINNKKENPNSVIISLIIEAFGSFNKFKKEFKEKALSIKGSGYTFLVLNGGTLEIINLLNQDCPYFYDLVPLIGIDMWEHAYYINYENKKDLYIDNFFEIMDFSYANELIN